MFWERWKREYIMTLQERRKWKTEKPNLHQGDVVLMKDSQAKRNEWPMVIITKTFPSEDNRVRKIQSRSSEMENRDCSWDPWLKSFSFLPETLVTDRQTECVTFSLCISCCCCLMLIFSCSLDLPSYRCQAGSVLPSAPLSGCASAVVRSSAPYHPFLVSCSVSSMFVSFNLSAFIHVFNFRRNTCNHHGATDNDWRCRVLTHSDM